MDDNTQPLVFAVLTFLSAAKSGRVVLTNAAVQGWVRRLRLN